MTEGWEADALRVALLPVRLNDECPKNVALDGPMRFLGDIRSVFPYLGGCADQPAPLGRRTEDKMSRAMMLSAVGIGSLLSGLVVAPTLGRAQYDLTTCTGNYNYCLEQTRRAGQPTTRCEVAYQQCMRRGTSPDVYNPRNPLPAPVERR